MSQYAAPCRVAGALLVQIGTAGRVPGGPGQPFVALRAGPWPQNIHIYDVIEILHALICIYK